MAISGEFHVLQKSGSVKFTSIQAELQMMKADVNDKNDESKDDILTL